ncbi:Lethal(2) giant larvae 2 [Chionoecetes opilio]|uniref:Lethal(2) giant larvae 2 n=1 Tax=Chionoecetes opilio TaxID=41210 RepID=A0A8J4Y6G4_CHIOP|nr:Lethal(2) giant larvae 2 [Chionoecetes opilio]
MVFSGGMPRASYGDRNTVTAIQGETHVTFSLSSKILDFVVVKEQETGVGSCLVMLAEEEVVFIDLEGEEWPPIRAPYLASLHSSAITCACLVAGVLGEVADKIQEAGSKQQAKLSPRPWPIDGGRLPKGDQEEEAKKKNRQKDILLTGHEDGKEEEERRGEEGRL